MSASTYLKWLDETDIHEVDVVGGKNASLGEMIKNLKHLNIKVPYGFVVTADSYDLYHRLPIERKAEA